MSDKDPSYWEEFMYGVCFFFVFFCIIAQDFCYWCTCSTNSIWWPSSYVSFAGVIQVTALFYVMLFRFNHISYVCVRSFVTVKWHSVWTPVCVFVCSLFAHAHRCVFICVCDHIVLQVFQSALFKAGHYIICLYVTAALSSWHPRVFVCRCVLYSKEPSSPCLHKSSRHFHCSMASGKPFSTHIRCCVL